MEKRRNNLGIFSCRKSGPHPAVIFIHGGFWRNAYQLWIRRPLVRRARASAGAAVWSLEYRRLGRSRWQTWAGISDDIIHGAQQLVALADRYNLDLKRVIAAGHSAGGQLALWLAAQQAVDLRGVVPLAAISDLRRAYALAIGWRGGGRTSGRLAGPRPAALCRRISHGVAADSGAAARGAWHRGQHRAVRYEPALREGIQELQTDSRSPARGIST